MTLLYLLEQIEAAGIPLEDCTAAHPWHYISDKNLLVATTKKHSKNLPLLVPVGELDDLATELHNYLQLLRKLRGEI